MLPVAFPPRHRPKLSVALVTTAMHLEDGTTEVWWSFGGAVPTATGRRLAKQEAGVDRRCFTQT